MYLILEAWWWLVFRNCSIQAWDEGWNALISRDFHECMVYWQNAHIKIVVLLGWFKEGPIFAQGPNNLLFKVCFYLCVCVSTRSSLQCLLLMVINLGKVFCRTTSVKMSKFEFPSVYTVCLMLWGLWRPKGLVLPSSTRNSLELTFFHFRYEV